MPKINRIVVFFFFTIFFYSCKGQIKADEDCKTKFKAARILAYANFNRQSALDSALHLINQCMQCDSIRKEIVDFKITLFISMKRYIDGIVFIDSLKETDFTFDYKLKFMSKGLRALEYDSKKDTLKRNLMYKGIETDIKSYIKNRTISEKEFIEIYTDLFADMEKYLDYNQINEEVETFKRVYPEKHAFFNFFKK